MKSFILVTEIYNQHVYVTYLVSASETSICSEQIISGQRPSSGALFTSSSAKKLAAYYNKRYGHKGVTAKVYELAY